MEIPCPSIILIVPLFLSVDLFVRLFDFMSMFLLRLFLSFLCSMYVSLSFLGTSFLCKFADHYYKSRSGHIRLEAAEGVSVAYGS